MANNDLLVQAFMLVLGIDSKEEVVTAAYRQTKAWDSVAHMRLVAEIEGAFNIMLETEDVIGMSSFAKAVEILTKYDVSLAV